MSGDDYISSVDAIKRFKRLAPDATQVWLSTPQEEITFATPTPIHDLLLEVGKSAKALVHAREQAKIDWDLLREYQQDAVRSILTTLGIELPAYMKTK